MDEALVRRQMALEIIHNPERAGSLDCMNIVGGLNRDDFGPQCLRPRR